MTIQEAHTLTHTLRRKERIKDEQRHVHRPTPPMTNLEARRHHPLGRLRDIVVVIHTPRPLVQKLHPDCCRKGGSAVGGSSSSSREEEGRVGVGEGAVHLGWGRRGGRVIRGFAKRRNTKKKEMK